MAVVRPTMERTPEGRKVALVRTAAKMAVVYATMEWTRKAPKAARVRMEAVLMRLQITVILPETALEKGILAILIRSTIILLLLQIHQMRVTAIAHN
jgi:hypothetical protein